MAGWYRGPLCGFDCETSGVDVENDRIVTITVPRINPGQPVADHDWLIAVDTDIPEAATAIHGITTEFARANGRPAVEVLDIAAAELALAMSNGVPVIGMNLAFDWTILDRELRRNNLPTLEARLGRPIGPVVDVLVLDKYLEPFRKGGRKLTDLCQVYDVTHDGAHNARADAIAACRIAYRMFARADRTVDEIAAMYSGRRRPREIAESYGLLRDADLPTLHRHQAGWRQAQQASLREYFEKKGIAHDGVCGDWPLIPHQRQEALR